MEAHVSWDGLRVFLTVARSGSFSGAAHELGIAQSSVSDQIARLEKQYGHRLLDRGPAGARPTERGAALMSRINDAVDAMARATTGADGEAGTRETVFVGGPREFLSEVVLPPLLRALPDGIELAVQFGLADEVIADLRAGRIDVAVSAVAVRESDLSAEPIYDEEFVVVAHPSWEQHAATDIDRVPVLAYGPDLPIIRRYWRSVFHRRPTALTSRVISPDLRALLRLCLDGAGMTVLPEYLVAEPLADGTLVRIHTPEVAPLNTLYVVTRRANVADQATSVVRDLIARTARAAL